MPLYPERRLLPPCPDPERYQLIQTKEGMFWRLKRGLKTPATVNSTFQANMQLMATCSPAVKRLLTALAPHMQGLDPGRIHSRFVALFRKGLKGHHFSYAPFKGIEVQPAHPLERLLQTQCSVTQPGYSVAVQVPIKPNLIQRLSPTVSGFYLEAVLVSGDPLSGNPLKAARAESTRYAFENIPNTTCTLQLPVADKPWLLLLKFCSLEDNEPAHQPRHYGMRVIEVGG